MENHFLFKFLNYITRLKRFVNHFHSSKCLKCWEIIFLVIPIQYLGMKICSFTDTFLAKITPSKTYKLYTVCYAALMEFVHIGFLLVSFQTSIASEEYIYRTILFTLSLIVSQQNEKLENLRKFYS